MKVGVRHTDAVPPLSVSVRSRQNKSRYLVNQR
jgi:hypothetical protein